jgi:hypothetical protein
MISFCPPHVMSFFDLSRPFCLNSSPYAYILPLYPFRPFQKSCPFPFPWFEIVYVLGSHALWQPAVICCYGCCPRSAAPHWTAAGLRTTGLSPPLHSPYSTAVLHLCERWRVSGLVFFLLPRVAHLPRGWPLLVCVLSWDFLVQLFRCWVLSGRNVGG